jgi:hypothetical protein
MPQNSSVGWVEMDKCKPVPGQRCEYVIEVKFRGCYLPRSGVPVFKPEEMPVSDIKLAAWRPV